MTIDNLGKMSEGMLLRLCEVLLQPYFPGYKPIDALATVTGIKRHQLDQARADKGSIGGVAWVRIERKLNNAIYHKWLTEQLKGME